MTDSHTFKLTSSCAFVISASLAVAYWVDLADATPQGCEGPAHFWAQFSKWYLLLSSILLALILMLNSAWKYDYSKLKKTIICLLFLPNLGTVAYVIGAFVSFHYRDRCPDLHDLIVVAFLVSILICISPCLTCFLLCLSGGVEAVKRCFGGGHRHHETATGYYQAADAERNV